MKYLEQMWIRWAKVVLCIGFWAWTAPTVAQSGCQLVWQYWQRQELTVDSTATQLSHLSESEVRSHIKAATQYLNSLGYLEAKIAYDPTPGGFQIRCYPGPQRKFKSLAQGNLADSVLDALHAENKALGAMSYAQATYWQQQIADYYANRGYPFASVIFDSLHFIPNTEYLSGTWFIDPGLYITYGPLPDSIPLSIRPQKLGHLLHISPGQTYAHQSAKNLYQRAQPYPYWHWLDSPRIGFANQKTQAYLPLAPKAANQLEGLLGIFPQPSAPPQLVGSAQLSLWNPLGFGSHYTLLWDRPQPQTQQLTISSTFYYPFGLRGSTQLRYQLWRQDSAFLQQDAYFQFSTPPTPNRPEWGGYLRFHQTNNLRDSVDWIPGRNVSATQSLAGLLAHSTTASESAMEWSRKIKWQIQAGIGLRTTEQARFFWEGESLVSVFQPFNNLWGILGRLQAGIRPANQLSGGEAYRLGGFQTLRGFNEREFYAAHYSVATVEGRLRTGPGSFLAAFIDQGWWRTLEDDTGGIWGTGIGLGMQWQLAAGNLQVFWATGRIAQTRPFSLDESKIHVGFARGF